MSSKTRSSSEDPADPGEVDVLMLDRNGPDKYSYTPVPGEISVPHISARVAAASVTPSPTPTAAAGGNTPMEAATPSSDRPISDRQDRQSDDDDSVFSKSHYPSVPRHGSNASLLAVGMSETVRGVVDWELGKMQGRQQ
jgi:hypothetical protein